MYSGLQCRVNQHDEPFWSFTWATDHTRGVFSLITYRGNQCNSFFVDYYISQESTRAILPVISGPNSSPRDCSP